MISAPEIATAFNQQNPRKTWSARPNNTLVHFNTGTGIVALVYDVTDNRFSVRFNKYQAAWGDYVKAIARTLYVVLSTLKSAGLPFEAPEAPEGIDIITSTGPDGSVYVRYDPPERDLSELPTFSDVIGETLRQKHLAHAERTRSALAEQLSGGKANTEEGPDVTPIPETD